MDLIALTLNLLLAAPPTCDVRGPIHYLDPVKVVVPKGKAFDAHIEDVPVRVTFGAGGRVTLTSEGPLAFTATAERHRIEVHLKENGTVEGLMTVGPSMMLEVGKVGASAVEVTTDDASGIDVGPFPVRCEQLTMEPPTITNNLRVVDATLPKVFAKGGAGTLRAEPNGGAKLAFESGDIGLDRLEVKGPWTKVAVKWADGSVLSGWLKNALEKPAPMLMGQMIGDLTNCPGLGVPGGTYFGPATLNAGADVFDADVNGHAWAHAQEAVPVAVFGNSGMVHVTKLPGVAACDLPAYVRAEDLTFPK